MEELRPPGSRVDLRSEPVLGRSASETSSTGTRSEEEVGFSAIGSGGADRLHDRVAMPGSSGSARKELPMNFVAFRSIQVDGLSIFYREAGAKNARTLLLLHGLPSSSRMFQPLFARLSDHYHLIAPDYPGFGHSDWPDPKKFAYTFDHFAEIMDHFTEELGISRYTLYMQDYGGPVGFR